MFFSWVTDEDFCTCNGENVSTFADAIDTHHVFIHNKVEAL
jgi:hypothetical protein